FRAACAVPRSLAGELLDAAQSPANRGVDVVDDLIVAAHVEGLILEQRKSYASIRRLLDDQPMAADANIHPVTLVRHDIFGHVQMGESLGYPFRDQGLHAQPPGFVRMTLLLR